MKLYKREKNMLLKELPKREEKKGLSIRTRREEKNAGITFGLGMLCGFVLFPIVAYVLLFILMVG